MESKPYAANNPLWGSRLIEVRQALGWPKDKLLRLFVEEANSATDFDQTYQNMSTGLLPKWGGSWELLERFARSAIENTKSDIGYSMYSRIYWNASQYYLNEDPNIFKLALVKWRDMKQGFDDMMRLYPHSAHNLNRYAVMACMAADKETYLGLRFRMGRFILPALWPSSYSLDVCDYKFAFKRL